MLTHIGAQEPPIENKGNVIKERKKERKRKKKKRHNKYKYIVISNVK